VVALGRARGPPLHSALSLEVFFDRNAGITDVAQSLLGVFVETTANKSLNASGCRHRQRIPVGVLHDHRNQPCEKRLHQAKACPGPRPGTYHKMGRVSHKGEKFAKRNQSACCFSPLRALPA